MEQRLFLIACVMYAFTLITRYLNKKELLKTPWRFAAWHSAFLVSILGCAWYVISFILSNGMGGEAIPAGKQALAYLIIIAAAFYGLKAGYTAKNEQKEKIQKADLDWANTVYFAGFVASFVMFFFIQAFKIPSASMRDTLLEGDHLFVNKAEYGFRIPLTDIRFGQFKDIEKGDIVIFSFPALDKHQINCGGYQYGKDYVKRVIGLPGDKVEIRQGRVWVNDQEVPTAPYEKYQDVERIQPEDEYDMLAYQVLWEKHQLDNELGLELRDNMGPVTVPEDSYFVMGDNRDDSCDSRFWGPVPRRNIKGKAWFIHWPASRWRIIK